MREVYFTIHYRTKSVLILYILICCVIVSILCKSRSFSIGYGFSIISLYFIAKASVTSKFKLGICILIFLLVGFSSVVLVKRDSSLGRLLIYKISFDILKDNYIKGVGVGNYKILYGKYQIDYFKNGQYSTKELLLADNSVNAFNDYLQFFIETGLIGLGAIIGMSYIVIALSLRSYTRNSTYINVKRYDKRNISYNHRIPGFLELAYAQIITICIAATFTHVFKHLAWQWIFLMSFSIVIYYNFLLNPKLLFGLTAVILLSITLYKYSGNILYFNEYNEINDARELSKAGMLRQSIKIFEKSYPQLKNDVRYLRDYAVVLMSLNDYRKAEIILKQLIVKENISGNYDLFATCLYKNDKLKLAEINYLNAIYRVPNKFLSRFHLYQFYKATKQIEKANEIKRDIFKLPVKIYSPMVSQIKASISE